MPTAEGLRRYQLLIREKKSGATLAARVRVLSAHGTYIAPLGHQTDPVGSDAGFKTLGRSGDIMWHGRQAWAYLDGEGVVDLPGGQIIIKAEKGPEYRPYDQIIDLEALSGGQIIVEMERWTDRQQEGWFAGDTHVHEPDPAALVVEARAEDVNVSSVLVANDGDRWLAFPYFVPGHHPMSDPTHVLQYGQEYRHNRLGHISFLGIEALFLPPPRLTPPKMAAGDWPTLTALAGCVKAAGGVVIWGHWPWPCGECPVAVALGMVDAFELLGIGEPMQTPQDMGKSYALLERTLDETFGRSVYRLSPLALYYLYLNCGFEIGLSAGSDKYMAWRIVGDARVYVHVEGELSYEAWIRGLQAGRSFVTTAPLVRFSVDGHGIGERLELAEPGPVTVWAESESMRPYQRLEIVVDGEVVSAAQAQGERFRACVSERVEITHNSWIVARCVGEDKFYYGPQAESKLPILAHTSPVYVRVASSAQRAEPEAEILLEQVLYLKEWVRERASYDSEAQRAMAFEQVTQAERVFSKIVEGL